MKRCKRLLPREDFLLIETWSHVSIGAHPEVVVEAQLMNRRRVAGSTPRRACVRIVCMLVSALLVFGLYILIVKTQASEKNGKRDDDDSYDDGINDDAASITVLKPTEAAFMVTEIRCSFNGKALD